MHRKFSPSSLHRVVNCPGSVQMTGGKKSDNSAANEGNIAHWFAADRLTGGSSVTTGTADILTDEIAENIKPYVTECLKINAVEHHVEEFVECPRIHQTECGGTPDHWCLESGTFNVFVDDLKYGWGLVSPFKNWQLLAYAIGICDHLTSIYSKTVDTDYTFILRIHQPRPYHPLGNMREWRLNGGDLRAYANIAHNACNDLTPGLSTGEHCRYCDHMLSCPANREACYNAIDVAGMPVGQSQDNLGRELSLIETAFNILKNRKTALESEILMLIETGKFVDGWTTENGRGKTVWSKSTEEVFALGDLLGLDLRNKNPITPAQAKTAGLPPDVVKSYSKYNTGGKKITRATATTASTILGGN